MNKKEVNSTILYDMTLACTMMSSYPDEVFLNDAKKIIGFIGTAYEMDNDAIVTYENLILGTMMKIGLISDYQACKNAKDVVPEDEFLYDIKGKVIEELMIVDATYLGADSRINQIIRSTTKHWTYHLVYDANTRYSDIEKKAAMGNVFSVRQSGLLAYLGIGCEKDIAHAKTRLTQAVLWGDQLAIKLLALIYKKEDNKECEIYTELSGLCKKYLDYGIITLEDEGCNKKAVELYKLISLVRQSIVIPLHKTDIDFSFVNMILNENITEEELLDCIFDYKSGLWRYGQISEGKANRIGFI